MAAMHHCFSSPFYNFELTRILGTTAAEGCDVAEFLEAVGELKKHDPESWYRAWWKQACRASQAAEEASRQGLGLLAKSAFLRAANYYRAAPYMLSAGDRRIVKCGELSAEHFEKATEFMEGRVLSLTFDFENFPMPGRLFLPPESKRLKDGQKTPILINCGGADSTMEELYFAFGTVGPEVGYAALNFDGPGQGLPLKRDGEPMRPDYEKVLSCVLDNVWALAKHRLDANLDLNRVCVAGISMGGYIALRTAALETRRVAACISADPLYDMWELAMTRLPVREFRRYSLRWRPEHEGVKGQDEDEEHGGNAILSQVICPVLVTGASNAICQLPDTSTQRTMDELVNVVKDKKKIWIPESVGQGALTGKVGAWNALAAKTFTFLDRHLGVKRLSERDA
ncbi:alpha beta hydrolase [Colletotrichum incanum]|nr:alpha beta hydrolase [Colletotrichum incanum]